MDTIVFPIAFTLACFVVSMYIGWRHHLDATKRNRQLLQHHGIGEKEGGVKEENKERPKQQQRHYHFVLGTAEVLRKAGLIPHERASNQEEWDESAPREKEHREQDGRTIMEVTKDFGEDLVLGACTYPFNSDLFLCVIVRGGSGLTYDFMSPENYLKAYWK